MKTTKTTIENLHSWRFLISIAHTSLHFHIQKLWLVKSILQCSQRYDVWEQGWQLLVNWVEVDDPLSGEPQQLWGLQVSDEGNLIPQLGLPSPCYSAIYGKELTPVPVCTLNHSGKQFWPHWRLCQAGCWRKFAQILELLEIQCLLPQPRVQTLKPRP